MHQKLSINYISQLIQSRANAEQDFKALVAKRKAILVESKSIHASLVDLMDDALITMNNVRNIQNEFEKANLGMG